jgi:hypothetical protein
MSVKETLISSGLLSVFVISQPIHHAVGDEPHFEERSDTSMAAATPTSFHFNFGRPAVPRPRRERRDAV